MTDDDARLDADLRDAGQKWRDTRIAPPNRVDAALFAKVPSPRRTSRAVLSVAGALVLLVVAAMVIVSLPPRPPQIANGSPTPSASQPASAHPSASADDRAPSPSPVHSGTPNSSPLPTIPVSDTLDWAQASASGIPPITDGFDNVASAPGGGFDATAHYCPSDTCQYLLLHSADGSAWSVLASIADPGHEFKSARFYRDDAVGYLVSSNVLHQGPGAGLWHSTDGNTWAAEGGQATFDASECGTANHSGTDIYNFYRAGDSVIALGRIYCDKFVVRAAWSSTDGQAWQRLATSVPADLVVADHGTFVGIQGGGRTDTLFNSPDGLNWTQLPYTPAPASAGSVSSGFVALAQPLGLATVLVSSDGQQWSILPDPLPVRLHGQIASDGSRAAVLVTDPGTLHSGALVSSTDGTAWTMYRFPTGISSDDIGDVAIDGNRLLVYSYQNPAVWYADLPAAPTPTASTPTLSTPTPTGLPNGTPHPGVSHVLTLPADSIKSVEADIFRPASGYYGQDGPLVAYTTDNWKDVQVANLESGEITDIAKASGNQQIVAVDLSGNTVAWEVGEWSGNKGATPCTTQGTLTWTIFVRDLTTTDSREVAHGVNTDVVGCAAIPAAMAVDGNFVAYVTEAPRHEAPHATVVDFWATDSGLTLRTIDSDVTVGALDMSGGVVAYIEGTPSADPYGWLDQTRLYLDHGDGSDPENISPGAESVALSDGRLVWTSYPQSDYPRIWSAAVVNGIQAPPIELVYGDEQPFRGDPFASGDLVTYPTYDGIRIWEGTRGNTYSSSPYTGTNGVYAGAADVVSSGGGWLVWAGTHEVNSQIVRTIQGLPLSAIPELSH